MRLEPRVLRCCRKAGGAEEIASFVKRVNSPEYDILEISGNASLDAVLTDVKNENRHGDESRECDELDLDEVVARFRGGRPRRKLRLVMPGPSEKNAGDAVNRWDTGIVSFTAATLSHEINNPLMAITANAEMLLSGPKELDADTHDKVRVIASEARRIQDVTRQLTDLQCLQYRETPTGTMIVLPESSGQVNRLHKSPVVKTDNKSLDKISDRNILAKR